MSDKPPNDWGAVGGGTAGLLRQEGGELFKLEVNHGEGFIGLEGAVGDWAPVPIDH